MSATRPSYLSPGAPLPYCEGCGHPWVLRALDDALLALDTDPADVAIVTDIGCVGLAGELLHGLHTVHTLHGRSPALATGLALADGALGPGRLKPVVLIGDGGAMVGIAHLVHAALLNADITVLVHNNGLFGISGGQAASLAADEAFNLSAVAGHFTPPADLVRLLAAARAGFLARSYADDPELAATIQAAIIHPGFAMVEILEYCPERSLRQEEIRDRRLEDTVTARGLRVQPQRLERAPFVQTYRERHGILRREPARRPPLAPRYEANLDRPVAIVLAGTAGEHVQSAARDLCAAAVAAGLDCTQKNDHPVTMRSGYSFSEVILSPFEISFTGVEHPDAIIVTSSDGLAEVQRRQLLSRLAPAGVVIADDSLALDGARRLPLREIAGAPCAALAGVVAWVAQTEIFNVDALLEAVRARDAGCDIAALTAAFASVRAAAAAASHP